MLNPLGIEMKIDAKPKHILLLMLLLSPLLLLIALNIANRFFPITGYVTAPASASQSPSQSIDEQKQEKYSQDVSLSAQLVPSTTLSASLSKKFPPCPNNAESVLEIKNTGTTPAELVLISANGLSMKLCEGCEISSITSGNSAFVTIRACYSDNDWSLLIKAANAQRIKITG
jgi:hypothetical protein